MQDKKLSKREDFKHARSIYLTDKALNSYESLAKKFVGTYPRLRWTLTNFSIQLMDKIVREKKLKPGDDLETILGI